MSDIAIFLPVDVEQLVVQFLLDQPEITDLVDQRVVTELPKDKEFPAIRVTQFDDEQASEPVLWLTLTRLQFDVWGGPKKLARTIADTVRAVLAARLPGGHPEGVVTGVAVRGLDTTPDDTVPTSNGRARPRCRFDVHVWSHPSPIPGS